MLSVSLKDKVALVTGGSRGIGRAAAKRLAQAGAKVAISFHSDRVAASEVVSCVENQGGEGAAFQTDISKAHDAQNLIDKSLERFGRLDIVICNAGIWEGAPVEVMSEGMWDKTLNVNLKGTWNVCRAAIPHLKGCEGRIVIVSSTAGQRGESGYSNYAASKGGQISFAKSLSTELAPFHINVNAVAPGWVDTDLNAEYFADERVRKNVEKGIPLGRIATPDDVALPILFLCSDWARHITGEVLNVNGGSVLCG